MLSDFIMVKNIRTMLICDIQGFGLDEKEK